MKHITEFRDKELAYQLSQQISRQVIPEKQYNLMEFCGGHTHAIHRYGIPSLLPKEVNLIHGPGCPVCVLPIARLDQAIALAKLPQVIFCSYADMMRVPGTDQQTLLKAKAQGAQVKMVYSVKDALMLARANPNAEVIFFAIGFETTTPPTAFALMQAKKEGLKNFSVYCNHVLTPIAMKALLQTKNSQETSSPQLDGFIGPAHVSIIIGSKSYAEVAEQFKKPIVISGFEPLDVMYSILLLIRMINDKAFGIKNQYTRAVDCSGNIKSQHLIRETMCLREKFEWRGLGDIENSAMKINQAYQLFDAEIKFPFSLGKSVEHKACECPAILRGVKKPIDCKLFAKACTPESPLGACMVSSEGACAAYYAYARFTH